MVKLFLHSELVPIEAGRREEKRNLNLYAFYVCNNIYNVYCFLLSYTKSKSKYPIIYLPKL